MAHTRFTVQHNPESHKYHLIDNDAADLTVIGEEAYVDASRSGLKERVFFHTEVSERYAGQGLASVLVQSAVEQAIADGYNVVPVCPYVARWFSKHPEYADHMVRPAAEHLRAVSAAG